MAKEPPSRPAPDFSRDPVSGLYARLGEEGFARLIAVFYQQVRGDDILAPMYPADDWDGSEIRLRDFLIQRCGGPSRYTDQRGHPRLKARHMPFVIDRAARDRWLLLMDRAIDQTAVPPADAAVLRPFLTQVADFMMNR